MDTNKNITLDSNSSNLVVTGNSVLLNPVSGSNARIEVQGSDTHTGLNLLPKGDARVNILGTSSNTGGLRLYESQNDSSNYIEIYTPSGLSRDYAYKLPSSDGSNGQFLKTNGTGTLDWDTVITSIKLNEIQNGDGDAVLNNPSGFIELKTSGSNANRSNAIVLTSNSGTNETIELHNIQGTGTNAINLVAHKGGINLEANSNIVVIPGTTGNVGINTIHPDYTLDVAGDVRLTGTLYVGDTQAAYNANAPAMRTYIYDGSSPTPYNVSYAQNAIIAFNNEKYDTHNSYNTSNYAYTVPLAGKYLISVNLYINYTPDNYTHLAVLQNPDSSNVAILNTNSYGAGGHTMSGVFNLSEGDVIKVMNLGANNLEVGAGEGYTEWNMHMINYGTAFGNSIEFANDNNGSLSVANTAVSATGRDLTVRAGNTELTNSVVNGGNLILKSGHASQTGTSEIQLWTCPETSNAVPREVVNIDKTGNVNLVIDNSSINFGDTNSNVSLTHVDNSGIKLNTNKKLYFRDTDIHISSDTDGNFDLRADSGINLNIGGTDELSITSAISTFGTNIVVPNDATIGSTGTTNSLNISSNGLVSVSTSISILPSILTSVSTNSGSPTLLDKTRSLIYFDLNSASAMYAEYDQVTSNGQVIHLFYDNDNASGSLRIDFGSGKLRSATGPAQYLTFNDSGQSSTLISVGNNDNNLRFCITNTGASVS